MMAPKCNASVLFHSNVMEKGQEEWTIIILTSVTPKKTRKNSKCAMWFSLGNNICLKLQLLFFFMKQWGFEMKNWMWVSETKSMVSYILMSYSFQLFSICFLSSWREDTLQSDNSDNMTLLTSHSGEAVLCLLRSSWVEPDSSCSRGMITHVMLTRLQSG